MTFVLKSITIIMLILLIVTQLVLISPYRARICTDNLNGNPIQKYYSIIPEGFITLGLLGEYTANSASILVNGRHIMTIDRFPVRVELTHGDVVEIMAGKESSVFHVYLSESSSGLSTDLKKSSVKIKPGMNRILRVNMRD